MRHAVLRRIGGVEYRQRQVVAQRPQIEPAQGQDRADFKGHLVAGGNHHWRRNGRIAIDGIDPFQHRTGDNRDARRTVVGDGTARGLQGLIVQHAAADRNRVVQMVSLDDRGSRRRCAGAIIPLDDGPELHLAGRLPGVVDRAVGKRREGRRAGGRNTAARQVGVE